MIRAVLTDIEGTTSSIAFVKDVLFPYARRHIAGFVKQHAADPDVRSLLDEAAAGAGGPLDDDAVIRQLIAWMDEDRKVAALKALQGMIWEAGYRQGDFTGHIYEDAADKLREWHEAGVRLYVFSSGSVPAQKLLFGYSEAGDLTPLFSGHFDTRTGAKREAGSYRAIARQIGLPAEEILFLSDSIEELDAARAAGLPTIQLDRDGNAPESGHRRVQSFRVIDLSIRG